MTKLLVVVDYQNDFVSGALGFPGAETLEPGILKVIETTLGNNDYVLFTRDTHQEDYLTTREGQHLPIPHCIAGSSGHALYGRLHQYEAQPHPHTRLLNKATFGGAEIGQAVLQLCGTIPDEISLCGLVTDICVVTNALLLHTAFPSATIKVLKDLVGSVNPEGASAAFTLLHGMGIAVV